MLTLQQVQYHLYAPIGPHNQNTLGYQRNVHDLFFPNDLREELQKKAAAALQTLPSELKVPCNQKQTNRSRYQPSRSG
jgi:hypothetical protein